MSKVTSEEEIQALREELEKVREEAEYYKKTIEDGGSAHKTEAVKELFDFPRDKLPQRTRLNEKQIQTFAIIKANMAMFDHNENRTWIEVYMDNVMEMLISLKGKGRDEGMGIFQLQAEEKESAERGFMP